jgi:hypothetical protein
LKDVIKTAKRLNYNKLILNSNNKAKTIWNIVKNEIGKYDNTCDPPPLTKNSKKIKNGLHIANAFNTYFSTMVDTSLNGSQSSRGSIDNNSMFTRYLSTINMKFTSALTYVPLTSNELKDIIKSLSNKNSSGYDEIYSKVIKSSMPFILSPLIHICNRSLSTGIFPTRLKYSQVRPIYKKGERSELSNYRPISILTSFSKIFEKVISNRLHAHVSVNNILDTNQYGFRKNCSVETATFNLINNILEALNSKKLAGAIFCDLTKAFDSVDHKILLSKLKFYGVQGNFFKLIASYLNNRYQRVVIKEFIS